MTDDLVSRLLAAIQEREKAARDAQGGPWHIGNAVDPTKPCNVLGVQPADLVDNPTHHLARPGSRASDGWRPGQWGDHT